MPADFCKIAATRGRHGKVAVFDVAPFSQEFLSLLIPSPFRKPVLLADPNFLREIVRATLQEVLEGEMSGALRAAKGERSEARCGYRSDTRALW